MTSHRDGRRSLGAAFEGEHPQLISTNLSQNEEDRLREVFAA